MILGSAVKVTVMSDVCGYTECCDGVSRPKVIVPGDEKDCAAACENGAIMHPVLDTVHSSDKHECGSDCTAHTPGVDYYGHAVCSKVVVVGSGSDLLWSETSSA